MLQILNRYNLTSNLQQIGDSLSGACPIHHGHNKSQFLVDLRRNCWTCFGDCKMSGSIIDFVSQMENVNLHNAALKIQQWFELQTGTGEFQTAEEFLDSSDEETNKPLGFVLRDLDRSHPYLTTRGLSQQTIEEFELGYCSKGLLKGRIAIPIHNESGELLAYAGRSIETTQDSGFKYRFPHGFKKSLVLYNLHRARNFINGKLILVEGFFAAMNLWQAGYRNVVACMGSFLSKAQNDLILKTVGNKGQVVLLFDEDESGRKGRSIANNCLKNQVNTKMVVFDKEGLEPDNLSPEELAKFL